VLFAGACTTFCFTIRFTDSQPPFGAAARAMPSAVESRRDAAKCVALATQTFNLHQGGLLGGVPFQVAVVGGQPVAEGDISNSLPIATLVAQCVACPFRQWLRVPIG
jgi:hypothetical protein